MSGSQDVDGRLDRRIDAVEQTVADLESSMRTEMTAACNAVRAGAHDRISDVERNLAAQMATMRMRLDIAVILLAGILAVAAWGVVAPNAGGVPHAPNDQRMEELVRAVKMLDANNPDHWTASGEPRTLILQQILSAELGYEVSVSSAERDLATVLAGKEATK